MAERGGEHRPIRTAENLKKGNQMDEDYTYDAEMAPKFDCTSLYPDGCVYNRSAIICPKDKRKPNECDHCGWNPRVAHRRSYQIRKEMYEQDVRDSV